MSPNKIKAMRLALNLSQDEFAERLGYSGPHAHNTVSRLESGEKEPSGPVKKLLEIMQRELKERGE